MSGKPFAPTRIVCATDLSEAADEALRQAHAMASRYRAALTVVHIVPDIVRSYLLFPQQHRQAYAEEAPKMLDRATEAVRDRMATVVDRPADAYRIYVETGKPYVEIVRAAEAEEADVLVVGARGSSGLQRVVLGSVAEQVLRHAHCPVLVAHPLPTTATTAGKVLAASDLSDPGFGALAAAAAEARTRGGKLLALHVLEVWTPLLGVDGVSLPASTLSALVEQEQVLKKEAEEKMAAVLARLNVQAEVRVMQGTPAPTILEQATESGAELLVLGTHGRTGLKRLLLGSVAERVLRAAHLPVLVVRLVED